MGAPLGNKNGAKAKEFEGALRRALLKYESGDVKAGQALSKVAEKLVELALVGEQWAITALADRLDGKPAQTVQGTGEGGEHLFGAIEWRVVTDPKN